MNKVLFILFVAEIILKKIYSSNVSISNATTISSTKTSKSNPTAQVHSLFDFFDGGSNIPLRVPSNLQSPSEDDMKYYINFAIAAYCDQSTIVDLSCYFCNLPNVEFLQIFYDKAFDTQGFLTVNHQRKEIVLAFRGSYNVPNVIIDMKISQVALNGNADLLIHSGILNATNSLYNSVSIEIEKLLAPTRAPSYIGYDLVLTGHSLGGAMAVTTIVLWKLDKKFSDLFTGNSNQLKLFTYGALRVGNQGLADFVNTLGIPCARVTAGRDLAPHSYLTSWNYFHHQNEFWKLGNQVITCNKMNVYENPGCSNSYGPLFNVRDHLFGYWVDMPKCITETPLNFFGQLLKQLEGNQDLHNISATNYY